MRVLILVFLMVTVSYAKCKTFDILEDNTYREEMERMRLQNEDYSNRAPYFLTSHGSIFLLGSGEQSGE